MILAILTVSLNKSSFRRPLKSCQFDDCSKEAIFTTLHCIDHILLADREQHMVRQCCFLYGLGEQCRMPVSDVIATIAVCNEHQNAVSCVILKSLKVGLNLLFSYFSALSSASRSRKAKENNSSGTQTCRNCQQRTCEEEEISDSEAGDGSWSEEAGYSSA